MKWRKKVLVAKIEGTYGVDATPAGANAILATNVQLTPLDAQEISRELERPYLGGQPNILVNAHVSLQFEVEVAGAGAAGTAPGYGVLHRACSLSETIDATPGSEKVTYQPVSGGQESCTLWINIDGTLHRMVGVRGNLTMRVRAGQIPKWVYSLKGLFVAPTATAAVAPDFTKFQVPQVVSDANTSFTIDGFAAVTEEFELDMGNDVQGRFLVGQEEIVLPDRNTRGSVNIEAPPLGTKDFFAAARAHARVPLALAHGTGAGNVVELAAPKVQIGRPSYAESQGVTHLAMPLAFTPDAGDDEFVITVR